MKWTREKPTAAGYYWLRRDYCSPSITQLLHLDRFGDVYEFADDMARERWHEMGQ